MNHSRVSAEDEGSSGHRVWLYAGVVLTEIVVVLSLWAIGKYFGS